MHQGLVEVPQSPPATYFPHHILHPSMGEAYCKAAETMLHKVRFVVPRYISLHLSASLCIVRQPPFQSHVVQRQKENKSMRLFGDFHHLDLSTSNPHPPGANTFAPKYNSANLSPLFSWGQQSLRLALLCFMKPSAPIAHRSAYPTTPRSCRRAGSGGVCQPRHRGLGLSGEARPTSPMCLTPASHWK